MGKNDKSVREALGKEAWDILIEKTEDGSIGFQHMKDISSALHPRIGGNHVRRVGNGKVCSHRPKWRKNKTKKKLHISEPVWL